ncbi:hypothetical protein [Clostridium sp. MD294]|uniref:hypothetical protein n=1 Tax=Clostridium sp. MD294 TaxID=97138 RepID=UPI0002CA4489|nr:hypothetical protein [Clostridium sp. MD294]NDO46869.1 hypothetical protein [Clostridium sp. MD294]USF28688.1 hypothetical protein C820_000062 [Clostridium sp. MD294]
MAREKFILMSELTEEQKQRLYYNNDPIRKIMLWGKDSKENNCLLVLYGIQGVEIGVKKSSNQYYMNGYLLQPVVKYTHYAVFHGEKEHLPSIPNTYYYIEEKLLCYKRGYKTAKEKWDYNREQRRYIRHLIIDDNYIVKEFYELEQKAELDYYKQTKYEDYVTYFKQNNITFEDFEIIEDPSTLFGFEKNSKYYNIVYDMFSKQRLYSRIKKMKEFIKSSPSVEEYEKVFKVASVELACGIFEQLTIDKNPILLEKAKEIVKSETWWAKKEYHNGLIRFAQNYISVFDEKLIQKQKEFIYKTLPEMDFHVKRLKVYGKTLTGKELEEYIEQSRGNYSDIYNNYWVMQYGSQKLYDKNTYTDGKNINNIAFKNTIQMARAYDMADAIGKITYYIDSQRTKNYLKNTNEEAYKYYQRYLRRIWDNYKATDENKFVEMTREFLASKQYYDVMYGSSFFIDKYFEKKEVWYRHIDDIMYIVKNSTHNDVLYFCYEVLQEAQKQNLLPEFELKELIQLSQVPNQSLSKFFEELLMPKLKALTAFDAEIMLTLMNMKSEVLQNVAKEYFVKTNGKFSPENIANMLCMDTIEDWYEVVKTNIDVFNAEEYIAFIKELTSNINIEYPENIIELLQNSVKKLDTATITQKQTLMKHFIVLLLNNKKMPEFMTEIAENVIFYLPYEQLKETLQNIELKHSTISERNYNTIALLKAVKEDNMLKDGIILSILETGTAKVVKTLTEIVDILKDTLIERNTTMLLLMECNASTLNKIAQSIFENMEIEKREKMHMILLDSPVERAYQYGLQKLEEWYGDKTPQKFVFRMLEHPCIAVKSYLSEKMEKAFEHLEKVQPDLYIYYVKTLLYLPNKAAKSKDYVYSTIPTFVKYCPQKKKEIENILLDIGSTNVKINAEKALVTFAQIQKEV